MNEFVQAFHLLPVEAVGVIEISVTPRRSTWLNRGNRCEDYCLKHGLHYANATHSSIKTLGQFFKDWNASLAITYSVPILPMHVLESLTVGAINVHHSILPAYRGGNPLLWQVIDGVDKFGITIHTLSARADEGDILGSVDINRPLETSKQQLVATSNREQGVRLLSDVLYDWLNGKIKPIPQPIESTTAAANHFPMEHLPQVLSSKQVSLGGLWEVACFFGSLPFECVPREGWPSWFRWVPSHIQADCHSHSTYDSEVLEKQSSYYIFIKKRAKLHLTHRDGCVVFKPRWHLSTFLYRLLV